MNIAKYVSLLAVAIGLSTAAHAQLNLANTGVDTSPANGFDDNYFYLGKTSTVGVLPVGPGTNAVIASTSGFPIGSGNWFADTTTSKWLRPGTTLASASTTTNDVAIYAFDTSFNFDASVYDLTTASIVIKTAADNQLSVYLNSAASPLFGSGVVNNVFPNFNTSFSLTQATGLQAGANTLYFYLTNVPNGSPNNTSNPSGFRVELDPNVTKLQHIAVPEPSTYAVFGAVGLLALVAFNKRRQR